MHASDAAPPLPRRRTQGPPSARGLRPSTGPAFRRTVWLVLLLALPVASAQTAALRAGWAQDGLLARLSLSEVPRAGGTAGLALVLSPAPGFDVDVRTARSVGGLGTLTLEASAGARVIPPLRARLRLAARGAFGPVAARVEANAWGAPAERFDPVTDPGPALADAGVSLLASADYRASGTWLLGTTLRGERGGAGTVVDARLDARARRLLAPSWDLVARASARVAQGGDGRTGVGLGVVHAPRREPEIGVMIFVDLAPSAGGVRLAPGLETHGARALPNGRLSWSARARPFAAERAPWLLEASYRRPLEEGAVRVDLLVMHGTRPGTHGAVTLGYERPFGVR